MENKKGLGRGLGSLLGILDDEPKQIKKDETGKIKEIDGERVSEIDIKLIDVNPNQPRKNFEPTALKELSDSIKLHGVIQPIIVNKTGERYIIVAGERRFRASKLAGLKTIPAIVKNYTEQQVKEVSLLENIQREDLNPVEVANAMRELLEIYGWTQDVLADRLGKSRSAVANTLRLLTLQPEVLALIESGKLSAGHARSLVVVSDPETQVKLAKLAVTKKVTVRDLEKAVKQLSNPQPKKVKVEPSAELKDLINLMQHKFATKVSFMGNDKKGRIYIDYYSPEDLYRFEEFLDMIEKGEFLEYDAHMDNYYGTPRRQLEEKLASGSVILDIEPNGAFQVKAAWPEAVLIFIAPPSAEELEKRLRGRGDTGEEQINLRLERSRWELRQSEKYDYIVINDRVEACAEEILNIIAQKAD